MLPLCFVLMPFGKKTIPAGRTVDFDAVYNEVIAPAVLRGRAWRSIRADEEQIGGTIHKPMFERLMLCDYAVADMTGANPNVYLRTRHPPRDRPAIDGDHLRRGHDAAVRPRPAARHALPHGRGRQRSPTSPATRDGSPSGSGPRTRPTHDDSPLFQLVDGMPRLEIDHAKTDIFRDRCAIARSTRRRLAEARRAGDDAVQAVAADPRARRPARTSRPGSSSTCCCRSAPSARRAAQEMIALHARMPRRLQQRADGARAARLRAQPRRQASPRRRRC